MSRRLQKMLVREKALNWNYVEEHLSYNSETGQFCRLFAINASQHKRYRPFKHYHNMQGYVAVKLLGEYFRAERLAWRFHYGEWPPMRVIFLNGNKDDLRIENLTLEDPLM